MAYSPPSLNFSYNIPYFVLSLKVNLVLPSDDGRMWEIIAATSFLQEKLSFF
jgi:hypothetical protein